MKRGAWTFALALAAAVSGCDKTSKYKAELEALPLHQSVGDAIHSPACSRLIKPEHAPTLPVPALVQGKGTYLVGFYAMMGDLNAQQVGGLEFAAAYPPGRGLDAMCNLLSVKKGESLGRRLAEGRSDLALLQAQAQYYRLLEMVAPAYFESRAASASEKQAAKELVSAFQQSAEPGLIPAYYKLSPDFWEYLRKEAGASIPKA
jgi:hypothetical protein